jgi:tRNA dimethylallyltransferase
LAPHPEKPLIVVLGPTGSGKSELALDLAERWNGEIVNCDSVQIYRGFDIGSAKLTTDERRGIAHHLLDVAGPGEDFTAGEYLRRGRESLRQIASKDKLAVVCGGTGFYLRALLLGLSPAPPRREAIRERLAEITQRHASLLHRFLRRSDPAAADRIHPNDHQKLIRAIEMACLEQTKPSEIQSRPRNPLEGFRILKLGLSPHRQALYARLNERAAQMFEHGLLEETQQLLTQGYSPASKPMQSLGYRQAADVLAATVPLATAIEDCRQKTRQYAKRQMTWFRAEPDVEWLHGFGTDVAIREQAFQLAARFLA